MLTASSCGSSGRVTVTVLSSRRPGRGPYKCVGGAYGWPNLLVTNCSFSMTFRYERDTTYYISVGSFDITGSTCVGCTPNVQLSLAAAAAPPEQPPGPAPLGTWPNPRTIPPGQAGLPFLSEQLTVSVVGCWLVGWEATDVMERLLAGCGRVL